MSAGGDDDRGGGDPCEAKKAKRARLADEEWDRAVLTKPEWGGHKNTCVEFKKYVGGLGGVGNGYKPLATRYSKKEKPLSMFSQQYRKFMSKLFQIYNICQFIYPISTKYTQNYDTGLLLFATK